MKDTNGTDVRFRTVIAASAALISVAAVLAAVAYLLSILLWHPGCCCCCRGAETHRVAAIAAPSKNIPGAPPVTSTPRDGHYQPFIAPPADRFAGATPAPGIAASELGPGQYSILSFYETPLATPSAATPQAPGPQSFGGYPLTPVAEPGTLPLYAAGVGAIALGIRFRRPRA